jgi:threonine/homoserine/homoserine lactone efflux protein
MEDPAIFVLAVLAITGTPGPTNSLLATAGATIGLRRSLPLIAAEASGYVIAILTIGLVLAPLLPQAAGLGQVLRIAVGIYLYFVAFRLWHRGRRAAAMDVVVTPAHVFTTTLLNPKAIVLAMVLPFGAPQVWPYLLGFLLLLACVSTTWIAAGAMLGRWARGRVAAGVVPTIGAVVVSIFASFLIASPFLTNP